ADDPNITPMLLVDEVRYDKQSPWPVSPDGQGDSLQRSSESSWGLDVASWLAAPPTPGVALGDTQPPELVNNAGASVLQGDSVLLTSQHLQYDDNIQPPQYVTYVLTGSPQHGRLELTTYPGVSVDTFTQ